MEQQSNTNKNNTLMYAGMTAVGILLVICITYFLWPTSDMKKEDENIDTKTEESKTTTTNTTSGKNLDTCLNALAQGKLQKNKNQLHKKMRAMVAYDLEIVDHLKNYWKTKLCIATLCHLAIGALFREKTPDSVVTLLHCFYIYQKKSFVLIEYPKIEFFIKSLWQLFISVVIYGGLSLLFENIGWVSLSFKQCHAKVATNEVKLKTTTKESKAYVAKLTQQKEDCAKAVVMLEAEYNKAKAALDNNTATKKQQKASATHHKLSNALAQYKSHQALLEDAITLMQLLLDKEAKRPTQQAKPKSESVK